MTPQTTNHTISPITMMPRRPETRTPLTSLMLLGAALALFASLPWDGRAADKKDDASNEKIQAALKEAKIGFDTNEDGEITSVTFGSQEQGPISVANLKLVAKIKTLKSLHSTLSFDHVATDELAAIAAIKSLESITLDCCKFTGSDLKKLSTLPNLTSIQLTDSTIDDNGAKGLSTIKTLTTLKIRGNQFSDAGMKSICNLTNLTSLNLAKNIDDRQGRKPPTITDAGVAWLKGMKQLKSLNLSGNQITDGSLKTILALKTLERLNLSDTKLTAAGEAKVKEALPDCWVQTKDPFAE